MAPRVYVAGESLEQYALPLTNSSMPEITLNSSFSGPIAQHHGKLYVGLTSEKKIVTYTLPLNAASKPTTILTGFQPLGMAIDNTNLYFANPWTNELLAFTLPVMPGNKPAVKVALLPFAQGYSSASGPAVNSTTLFVVYRQISGNQTFGVVQAFSLPLSTNEKAEYTVQYPANSGFGDVVATNSDLYVGGQQNGVTGIFDYKLPYVNNENPVFVRTPGDPESGLALDAQYLYVTDGSNMLSSYALPIHAGEKPTAAIQAEPGSIGGVAAI